MQCIGTCWRGPVPWRLGRALLGWGAYRPYGLGCTWLGCGLQHKAVVATFLCAWPCCEHWGAYLKIDYLVILSRHTIELEDIIPKGCLHLQNDGPRVEEHLISGPLALRTYHVFRISFLHIAVHKHLCCTSYHQRIAFQNIVNRIALCNGWLLVTGSKMHYTTIPKPGNPKWLIAAGVLGLLSKPLISPEVLFGQVALETNLEPKSGHLGTLAHPSKPAQPLLGSKTHLMQNRLPWAETRSTQSARLAHYVKNNKNQATRRQAQN